MSRHYKRHIACSVFGLLFCLNASNTVKAEQRVFKQFRYYYQSKEILLHSSSKMIAAFFNSKIDHQDLSRRLQESAALRHIHLESKALPNEFVLILEFSDNLPTPEKSDLIRWVESDSDVLGISPIYVTGDTKLIPAGQLIIRFEDTVTETQIHDLLSTHDLEVIEKLRFHPSTFLLKQKRWNYEGLIDLMELHHNYGFIKYVQPNFLKLLKPPGNRGSNDASILNGGSANAYLEMPRAAQRSSVNNEIQDYDPPKQGAKRDSEAATSVWSTIMSEDFEGAFPNDKWWVFDGDGTTNGEYFWDDAYWYNSSADQWSAWCADGGRDRYDWNGHTYPHNMKSWMVYGPFDLSDATFAGFDYYFWLEMESGVDANANPYDYFSVWASTDGQCFYGVGRWGFWTSRPDAYSGWLRSYFDLSDVYYLGDLTGRPQVWLAFYAKSDSSVAYQGPFVDNIALSKIRGTRGPAISADPYSWRQWALNNAGQTRGTPGADIDAPAAWSISKGISRTIIAIVDEGVDLYHEDLDLVPGYDATGYGSNGGCVYDDAHGTACAGIAAAKGDNNLGIIGVCPRCRIMPVRIAYTSGGTWVTYDSWLGNGISWAALNGAKVLSNSWGGGTETEYITGSIQLAISRGCVVVFAAGNSNSSSLSYPARLPEAIAVGASSPCDERKSPYSCDGEGWWGSNYGEYLDVLAPGVLITTTDIQIGSGYASRNYYSKFNGTSAATPHVAGLAGLILSVNPFLEPDYVSWVITWFADDLGDDGWDLETGWGRINASRSLEFVEQACSYVSKDSWCGGRTPCYSTVDRGVANAPTFYVVKLPEGTFNETLHVNNGAWFALMGGYDLSFFEPSSFTTIHKLEITAGTVVVDSIIIR